MIHKLETEQPQWAPGTAHGYHALIFGWLAGELVRRADKKNRTLGQFIRDEIANPLQIEFYIGLPSKELHRVSPLDVKSNGNVTSNDSTAVSYEQFIDNRTYQVEIPAANGITNARSVARLYASLMDDIEDNNNKYKRILSDEILKQATKLNTPRNEIDAVLNLTNKFGMGFSLMDEAFPLFGPVVFGHIGVGGSIGFAAPSKNFSFAYVMNRMGAEIAIEVDPRYNTMLNKIATMINRNGASLRNSPSSSIFLFITAIFYIKFVFY